MTLAILFAGIVLWACFALATLRVARTIMEFDRSQDDILVGYIHEVWLYAVLGPIGLLLVAYDLDAMLELYIKPKRRL